MPKLQVGVTTFYPIMHFRGHATLEDIQTGQDPPEQPESLHFYPTKEKVRSLLRLGGKELRLSAPQQEGQFLFCLPSCAAVRKDLKLSRVLQGNNIDFFLFYPAKPVKSSMEQTISFILSFILYQQFPKQYDWPGVISKSTIIALYCSVFLTYRYILFYV